MLPLSAVLLSALVSSQAAPGSNAAAPQIGFEENQGQEPANIKFVLRSPGRTVFLHQRGLTFANAVPQDSAERMKPGRRPNTRPELLHIRFSGGQPGQVIGETPLEGKANILIGSDPSRWRTQLPTFGQSDLRMSGRGSTSWSALLAPGTISSCPRERIQVEYGSRSPGHTACPSKTAPSQWRCPQVA